MSLRYLFFFVLIAISCGQKDRLSLRPSITQNPNVKKHLSFLASDKLEGRVVGSKGEALAAEYISSQFFGLGLSPMDSCDNYLYRYTVHKKPNPHSLTPTGDIPSQNVMGMMDNGSDKYIIIGAHYDHLGYGHFGTLWDGDPEIHNGADDNASGVSLILDLAEKLKKAPKNYNYVFMAFSGEEMGLWGSNYWVKHPNIDLSKVNYMLNFDMVGRLNAERALAIHGTGTSPVWDELLDAHNHSNFNIVKTASGVGPSDHTSFYNADIPVLHFFTGQHSDYHKPSDDVEKINFQGIADISSYVFDIINALDAKEKISFTKTVDESTAVPDFKVTLGVMPDYLYNGDGMRIDGIKENRPAANAQMQKGDVVIKMGDREIKDMMSYMEALAFFNPGETVQVVVLRNDKEIKLMVKF